MSDERFIVKAIGPDEISERWLTTPRLQGMRAFGPRKLAAVFVTWEWAERAIREIRKSEDCSEIAFEIHTVKLDR